MGNPKDSVWEDWGTLGNIGEESFVKLMKHIYLEFIDMLFIQICEFYIPRSNKFLAGFFLKPSKKKFQKENMSPNISFWFKQNLPRNVSASFPQRKIIEKNDERGPS